MTNYNNAELNAPVKAAVAEMTRAEVALEAAEAADPTQDLSSYIAAVEEGEKKLHDAIAMRKSLRPKHTKPAHPTHATQSGSAKTTTTKSWLRGDQ
jgi:hypothetical protein